jgi:hypothetical protein
MSEDEALKAVLLVCKGGAPGYAWEVAQTLARAVARQSAELTALQRALLATGWPNDVPPKL